MAEIHAAGAIIEPLVCRPTGNLTYVELGPGERRLCAAKQMSLKTVPVIVEEFTDLEFDKIRVLENLARKDLSDMEIARILKYLTEKYPEEYPTQEALANAFNKTQQWISNHLRMLELEKDDFTTRVVKPEKLSKITERQAREILSAPTEKRREVAERIAEKIQTNGEIPSARELHKIVHPEPQKTGPEEPSVPCELCGSPVSEPVHVKGKFYCEDCVEKILHPELEEEPEPEELEEPSEAEFDVDRDIAEGLVSDNVKWILRNSTGDINYQTTIPLLTDEELAYCLEHEKRKTGLRQLETETRRRENLDETPDFHGTALTGRHCPVCNHLLTQETYDRLKTKFSGFRGLFR